MSFYDPDVANISPEEFAELMKQVNGLAEAGPVKNLSPDGRWREDYRREMAKRRELGVQLDMWGKHVTHYRRNPDKPAAPDPRPQETLKEKLARIRDYRAATFGPERADRPTFLTDAQRDEIARGAANWLRIGQRVRIVDGPGEVDPQYARGRIGREGVVWRLCSPVFRERVYVFLDPVGAERTDKVEFIEIRDIEPIE